MPLQNEFNAPAAMALRLAIADGTLSEVERLLRLGANLSLPDDEGRLPLTQALAHRRFDLLPALTAAGAQFAADPPHVLDCMKDFTAEEMEQACAAGFDPEIKNSDTGESLIHIAAQHGNAMLVYFLAQRGLDVNAKNKDGNTPLHLCAAFNTPEYHATMQVLIACKAKPAAQNDTAETPLHISCAAHNIAGAEILLAEKDVQKKLNTAITKQSGFTPLHLCAMQGLDRLLARMESLGGNINRVDYERRNCLFIAAQYGRLSTVRLLLSRGADIQEPDPTATVVRNFQCIIHTVSNSSAGDNRHQREIFQALVDAGGNIDMLNCTGTTALQTACFYKEGTTIRNLLAVGADPEKCDRFGGSPADLLLPNNITNNVLDKSVEAMLCDLLDAGISTGFGKQEGSDSTLLHRAIGQGFLAAALKMIAQKTDIDTRDRSPRALTPFLTACILGQSRIAMALKAAGANVLTTDAFGTGALNLAVTGGDAATVEYLLSLNCFDLNTVDARGRSVLHIACRDNRFEIAKLLLAAGARTDLRDEKNRTAFDFAHNAGHKKVTALFLPANTNTPPVRQQPAPPKKNKPRGFRS